MSDDIKSTQVEFEKITLTLNAMQFAQLTAFSFGLPQLYFCREYLALDEETAINHCKQRILNLIANEEISLQQLTHLLTEKEYFDADEARLRLGPELSS
tara:strand:+ start:12004 stop:12300 length:297 start_codon:yes stop_codon:yes gene_type:complete